MADYYPLLAKAVSGLPESTEATRRAIYERARKALLGQLRAIEPPIAEADILRENSALDESIARLEAEIAGKAAAAAQPLTPPAPPPVAPAPIAPPPKIAMPPRTPPAPPKSFSFRAPAAPRPEEAPAETPAADAAATPASDPDAQSPSDLKPPRPREAPRPPAPAPAAESGGGKRLWILGGVVAGVVLLVAGLAIKLRDRPEDLAHLRPAANATGEAPQNGKIVERVGKTPGETKSPSGASTTQNTPAGSNQPAVPVAHRAALLLEAPDTVDKVKTFVGSVVWRLDSVPSGPGQPLGTAVHADVDIPEAKIRMTVDIQKNMDQTLPASHTIEIRFTLLPGGELPGVKQISTVQMRREDSANGDPLAGLPVQITDSFFLIGLARGDMETRNVDMLKTRGWLDLPLALTNGRIAKFTLEKGVSGDRAIADAITAWDLQK